VTGISELVLEVRDLEAASAFYRDVLGFEETMHGEGREDRLWYLVGESARIGLWTPQEGIAGGRGGAHVHFAFHLRAEDFDPLLKRLQTAGAELIGPIRFSGERAVYVHDPDGNVLEFWTQDMAAYAAEARAGAEG
jgi:catechol 2,3-dioxygenase-like lactoylglutathione lyase family enzyme